MAVTTTWRYYNHALIPTCAPHEAADVSLWAAHGGGTTFFARWTSDFDCGYETGWWYEVKDTPVDLRRQRS